MKRGQLQTTLLVIWLLNLVDMVFTINVLANCDRGELNPLLKLAIQFNVWSLPVVKVFGVGGLCIVCGCLLRRCKDSAWLALAIRGLALFYALVAGSHVIVYAMTL